MKDTAFLVTLYMGFAMSARYGLCCLQYPKSPINCCASFLLVGLFRFGNFSITLFGMFPPADLQWMPKNVVLVSGGWILSGLIVQPSDLK